MLNYENFLKKGVDYTFINPYSYLILRKFRKEILMGSDFVILLDGFFLVLILKIFGIKNIERVSFDDSSLAPHVFKDCSEHKKTIALIGSAPNITQQAKEILEKRYPNIQINYVENGFYKSNEEQRVIANALLCDVVICSMGTPKQEDLLVKLRELNWNGTGYTCGGYLDQLVSAKGEDYYPYYIDKFNMRWLYRIYKEPRRLLFRYLIDYPKGILVFIYDYILLKRNINLK
ncbi:WecB/TagA/CpsF family glycosyltransferase [Acinetobacter johnsonii]|uniref:WecB/TagA/CpsF family glycosyltransferase n=1 Tax=Acinetobacter johnsonii TaxID=40214 RepID=UPI00191FF20B|nr:WecB/TagA/CpsF family glycosyltransferase [Acinetobacter johnsonii]QQV10604.1 WecB/TagA/CpsF family glycosyltransferase [Acinetobacter johnsonii]